MILSPSPQPSATSVEQRRSPRIEILGHVKGQLEASDIQARVLDINLGGFGLLTTRPFDVGTTHRFRFTMPDGQTATLAATTVHCDRRPTRDGSELYLAGFRFPGHQDRRGDTTAADLLDQIKSVMSFDII